MIPQPIKGHQTLPKAVGTQSWVATQRLHGAFVSHKHDVQTQRSDGERKSRDHSRPGWGPRRCFCQKRSEKQINYSQSIHISRQSLRSAILLRHTCHFIIFFSIYGCSSNKLKVIQIYTHMYIYIHFLFHLLMVYHSLLIQFPVLYSRTLLFIHPMYSRQPLLIPNSQSFPPCWQPQVCSLCKTVSVSQIRTFMSYFQIPHIRDIIWYLSKK